MSFVYVHDYNYIDRDIIWHKNNFSQIKEANNSKNPQAF